MKTKQYDYKTRGLDFKQYQYDLNNKCNDKINLFIY